MATGSKGAASSRPRHTYTLTAWEDGTTAALGATVEVVSVRGADDLPIERAQVDVDYDHESDEVVVTIRRIEDDPTVKVVLV